MYYRFFDIAWGQPNNDRQLGIIAGALESGSLELWDAERLRTNSSYVYNEPMLDYANELK